MTAALGDAALSVLIADDHPLFRMGLRYALRAQGFDVRAEASDGHEALALCRAESFDVVLLDVKMPTMDGIEACAAIAALPDPPVVVMLTTFEEPAIVRAATRAGAAAYLSKETSPEQLAATVREIVAHPERRWIPQVDLPDLTPREADVLALLAGGLSNKAMAKRLGLSPETIKDHLNGLYRKLEVRDRLAALARAQDFGLLDR